MTTLTFTWRESKNNVQEIKENTMLQHLQLIKPKKVYKIDSYLEKLQKEAKKHDTTKT